MAERRAGPTSPPEDPAPGLERLANSCRRFLVGDGPSRVPALLTGISTDTVADRYGEGGVAAELEAEVASLLGKPGALLLPSGTMAQQAILRVHADRRSTRSVAFHPACHLESHKERGYQRIHGLFGVPVGPGWRR